MVEYVCQKGHIFIHPMKKRKYDNTDKASVAMNLGSNNLFYAPLDFAEFYCCPHCNDENTTFEEYVKPEPEITSVRSVDLSQVDDYLKQGYVVRELYAKTATLVKMEVKA